MMRLLRLSYFNCCEGFLVRVPDSGLDDKQKITFHIRDSDGLVVPPGTTRSRPQRSSPSPATPKRPMSANFSSMRWGSSPPLRQEPRSVQRLLNHHRIVQEIGLTLDGQWDALKALVGQQVSVSGVIQLEPTSPYYLNGTLIVAKSIRLANGSVLNSESLPWRVNVRQ